MTGTGEAATLIPKQQKFLADKEFQSSIVFTMEFFPKVMNLWEPSL